MSGVRAQLRQAASLGGRPRARWWSAHGGSARTIVWATALAITVGCRGAGTKRQGIRAVQPTHVEGYLEYITQTRERSQVSKAGLRDTESKEQLSEQNLGLEMTGYAYHPNFLEFVLGGVFGLLQRDYEDNYGGEDRSSSDDGTVVEFNFEGSFFKKKKYPGTVFARRYRALEPRAFQPSLEVTATTYGLSWQYIHETFPTSFEFSQTELTLDSASDFETSGLKERTLARFETAYQMSDYNVLSLRYDYESIREEPFTLDYDTQEVTLTHSLDFGDNRQHRLESELNYFDQRGTFNIERVRWRELLRFKHSETLSSWYQFEAFDRTQGSLAGVPPIEERTFSLRGTLEHRLYESLVTQVLVYGQTQEFGRGLNIDRYGGQINLDYRKKNRWGALQAGYRFRVEREDRTGGDQQAEVLNESATFHDPEPVVLRNTNIQPSSIVITAEDGFTFFRSGQDFTLRALGDQVEIRRVPTGRIVDGQTVLIDYVYEMGGFFTLDTINHQIRIRQNFEFGLSPYYRFRWQEQTLTPADALGVLEEDIVAHVAGVEFRRGALYLQAEYEDYASTVSPYRVIRLGASYTRRFNFGATGSLKARWTDINQLFPNTRETEFFTIEGRYRHPITKTLTVEGNVRYRGEMDTIDGRDEGIDVDLALEWTIRQTDIKVTYEFVSFEDRFADNESTLLYVQIRRRF